MAAVWIRLRAEVRTRWRALLGLTLLVGLAGGLVVAAIAGARRTDSATVLVANLVAALPGRAAARTRPAVVLRAE